MKVLIDASAAVNQRAGIGRYAREIVGDLLPNLPGWQPTLWYAADKGFGSASEEWLCGFPQATVERSLLSRRNADRLWFRSPLQLAIGVPGGAYDLFYSPDFTVPPIGDVPAMITVHDLAFEIVPEHMPPPLVSYLQKVAPRQCQRARTIFAASETTRQDLIDRYRVPESRVVVARCGVEDHFFAPSQLTVADRQSLGISGDYLLAVGTVEPRKNYGNLIEAIRRIPGDLELPLVIAGQIGWGGEAAISAAQDLVDAGRVVFTGWLPEATLLHLYGSASAAIYVPWYEGFGLPVLEAMAAGLPVVASDIPSAREVAGDFAIFAEPGNPEAIADAIMNAVDNPISGANRQAMIDRARIFDWSAAAETVAGVFRGVW